MEEWDFASSITVNGNIEGGHFLHLMVSAYFLFGRHDFQCLCKKQDSLKKMILSNEG